MNRAAALLLAVLLLACSTGAPKHASRPTRLAPAPPDRAGSTGEDLAQPGSPPRVNIASLHGFGKLAFISSGHVWLIDGVRDRLIDLGLANRFVGWSASGRYLMFVQGANSVNYDTETDQSQYGATSSVPTWSPAADRLAIGTAGVLMVEDKLLARGESVSSVAWSPDGRLIAYQDDPAAALVIDAVAGAIRARVSFPDQRRFWVDSWSTDRRALLVFESWQCNSCIADGQVSWLLPLNGGPPVQLPARLQHRALRSWSPAAPLLLMTQGKDRVFWDGKSQAVCDVNGSCRSLPQPEGLFDFQGRWAPGGHEIAFLRAPVLEGAGFAPPRIQEWYGQHELWAASADGTGARRLDPIPGAVWADWASDGHHLLEIRDRWLWMLDATSATSIPIAGPLDDTDPTYYGWFDWGATIAWWRGPAGG